MKFEQGARWSYNQLRFNQPQIVEDGLFELADSYYILCPQVAVATLARDNTPLFEWFEHNRQMGCPIKIVQALPTGATRVRDVTLIENSSCSWAPRTRRDVYSDLALELPLDFPHFAVQDGLGHINILVERPLNADEANRLSETIQRLKLPVAETIVDAKLSSDPGKAFSIRGQGDIDLLPARTARARGLSESLCRLLRQDEECWLVNRTCAHEDIHGLLPKSFKNSAARCVVNAATFPTADIRNYLSLYDKVSLVAPLAQCSDDFYSSAHINEDELVELAHLGRVEILLPQAVDRYSESLINKLAERAPDNIILSRQLALATLQDSHTRIPLLYPRLPPRERVELLRALLKLTQTLEDLKQQQVFEAFILDLGRIWKSSEELLHRRGAMANAALGIALPLTEFFTTAGCPERGIEFTSAAMTVEWAGALKASVIPIQTGTYSDYLYTKIVANLYSGVQKNNPLLCETHSNVNVTNLLAIRGDVPVLDFARSFTSDDITRFRACVRKISRHKYNSEETAAAIASFNKEVQRYACNAKRIAHWNMLGFILDAASLASGAGNASTYISIGIGIFYVLKQQLKTGAIQNPIIAQWVDHLEATLMSTTPEAVLVCRLQERLKSNPNLL